MTGRSPSRSNYAGGDQAAVNAAYTTVTISTTKQKAPRRSDAERAFLVAALVLSMHRCSRSTPCRATLRMRGLNPLSDEPAADLLTQRLTVHEQSAWMLRALLET